MFMFTCKLLNLEPNPLENETIIMKRNKTVCSCFYNSQDSLLVYVFVCWANAVAAAVAAAGEDDTKTLATVARAHPRR